MAECVLFPVFHVVWIDRPFEDWILDAHTQSLLAQLAELASATDVEKSGLNDLLAEEFDAAATRRSVLES